MIDIHTEDLFSLSKGSPDLARRCSPATRWRWALRGIRRGGRRHLLETIMIGGRRYSSRQALDRFLLALNEPEEASTPGTSTLRTQQRVLAAKRAATTF